MRPRTRYPCSDAPNASIHITDWGLLITICVCGATAHLGKRAASGALIAWNAMCVMHSPQFKRQLDVIEDVQLNKIALIKYKLINMSAARFAWINLANSVLKIGTAIKFSQIWLFPAIDETNPFMGHLSTKPTVENVKPTINASLKATQLLYVRLISPSLMG